MEQYYYKRLQELREDSDYLQKDIAKALNITQQQYQLYESGRREIKTHQIIELAQFYHVTTDYILGLTNTPYDTHIEHKTINIKKIDHSTINF